MDKINLSLTRDEAFICVRALNIGYSECMLGAEKARLAGFDAKYHTDKAFGFGMLCVQINQLIHEKKWCADPACKFSDMITEFRKVFKKEFADRAMDNLENPHEAI